ncbi:MAG TPA: hypothetical protein VFD42_08365 [Chloroflexota bacterium]|nr:hypothetical protein [Chloroflexota bacterium]
MDYLAAPDADVSWLSDQDDFTIIQTALAAGVPGTLVTENSRDFPLGQVRNGITILGSSDFLDALYQTCPEAEAAVTDYLSRRKQAQAGR